MADDEDILTSTDPDDSDGEPAREEFAFERALRRIVQADREDQRAWSQDQFSDLKGCVGKLDGKVDGLCARVEGVEQRCQRMEADVSGIVRHYHETATIVSVLESRTTNSDKRLSDEHKSLNALAEEQRRMRLGCVVHNGKLEALTSENEAVKKAISEHGETAKKLSTQLSQLSENTGVFQARVHATWKTVAVGAGTLIAALGATLGLLKAFGVICLALMLLGPTGCTSSSLRTATVLNVESKYRTGVTVQQCGHADELIPLVEKAWPIILDEMVAVGLVEDKAALEKKARGTRVCLLEEPDLCGPMSTKCIGIPQCARKRGCADAWGRFIRVSRWWPPICRGAWPTESHCVAEGQPRSSDYKKDLVAEMGNFIYQASEHKDNYHGADAVLKAITAAIKRLGW